MASIHLKINSDWMDIEGAGGGLALDFLRGRLGLTGTKEGCREGDCGACAVMVGELASAAGLPKYRAVPSCLLALGGLAGKHILTIEGLVESAPDGITPVMAAFLEENASQCGFCSPGFIISLTSWLAQPGPIDLPGAIVAVDGNLCRCTGYGAIRRAAERLIEDFADLPQNPETRLFALVERGVLPKSVKSYIEEMRPSPQGGEGGLKPLPEAVRGETESSPRHAERKIAVIGGGTDYYVRNPDPEPDFDPILLSAAEGGAEISQKRRGGEAFVEIGAAATVHDFFSSPLVRAAAPGIENFEREFASSLVRNLATVGGNIANASPVGDVTSMLMGLGAALRIGPRLIPIEKFFLGYKKVDLAPGEYIAAVQIPALEPLDAGPGKILPFSFEKISKRGSLDIAAVNTAMSFKVLEGRFRGVRISAGGVAPTPILLEKAQAQMEGVDFDAARDARKTADLARAVSEAAVGEINPINDVRGSADYRRLMAGKLILAHFLRFFSLFGIAKELFP